MAQKITITPSVTKIILFVAIGLIAAANIGVYFLGRNIISENATALNELSKELKNQQAEIDKIESIKSQMKKLEDIPGIVAKTSAERKDNRHQEKIVELILKRYAELSGLHIKAISFDITSKTAQADKEAVIVNVDFESPTSYTNVFRLIKLTELSLPRIQILNLQLSKAEANKQKEVTHDDVNVNNIQLKIYAK